MVTKLRMLLLAVALVTTGMLHPPKAMAQSYCSPLIRYGGVGSPYGNLACAYDIGMNSFVMTGESSTAINNTSGCHGMYMDLTTTYAAVSVTAGNTYTVTVTGGSTYGDNVQVWIDFNNDGTFSSSEAVGGLNAYYGTGTFSITIPAAAPGGIHRMRVYAKYTNDDYYADHAGVSTTNYYPTMDPCITSNYGEVHDYNVAVGGSSSCPAAITVGGAGTGTPGYIYAFAGNGGPSHNGDGGPATAAGIYGTYSAAVDASGNVYIPELAAGYIRMVNTSGIITTVAGDGTGTYHGDGGPATAAGIMDPWGIQIDAAGNMYFGEYTGQRIRKISAAGIVSTIAGTGTSGYSGDGGPATAAAINYTNGLALDAAGNVYFADTYNNRVRKVNTSGIISTVAGDGATTYVAGSAATATGIGNVHGLALDAAGNIYIGTDNYIYKVNTSGTISTYAGGGSSLANGVPATSTSLSTVYGMLTDNSGNLYLCDELNNLVRKIDASGIITIVAGTGSGASTGNSGPATAAGVNQPTGLAFDGHGNLYIAEYPSQAVRRVALAPSTSPICVGSTVTLSNTTTGGTWSSSDPSIATIGSTGVVSGVAAGTVTISYTLSSGCAATSIVTVNAGPAITVTGGGTVCAGTTAMLTATGASTYSWSGGITNGVAFTPSGTSTYTVTGTTGGCNSTATATVTVSSPTISGTATTCVGNTTTLTGSPSDGSWTSGSTSVATISASGIVTGIAAGSAIVSYTAAGCLATTAITVTTGTAITSGGTGSAVGYIYDFAGNGTYAHSGDGGPATAASFQYPYDVTTDASGNVFVSELTSQYVRKINAAGIITTIAGNGSVGYSGDGGPATAASVHNPWDMTTDNAGNVYFCDTYNYRVRKVTPSGTISTVIGNGSGFSGDGGPATAALIGGPFGIAIDAAGNMYFSDNDNLRVRKVNTSGIITTIAGDGTTSYVEGGVATAHGLPSNPYGLAVDAAGNVYVGAPNIIYKISTSGIISTFAGGGTSTADGVPATTESLGTVIKLIVDNSNNFYFADYVYNRVRKIDASGIITTIAGTGTPAVSGSGGPATAANIQHPTGVALDGSGNLYVTEFDADIVRRITLSTGPSVLCAGSTTTLSNATAGGTWSSGNPAVAAISSTTGVVSGVAAGTAMISYTLPSGCFVTSIVTVNSGPAITVTGGGTVCAGATATLTATGASSYSWSGGITNGVAFIPSGTTTYTVTGTTGGCNSTATATVTVITPSISGTAITCIGNTTTLTGSPSGGTWSSNNSAVATVGSAGVTTGVSAGTAVISYNTTCGSVVTVVTVNAAPSAGTITGVSSVSPGSSITLYDDAGSGSWSAGNANATVSAAGIVTGVIIGTSVISYTVPGTCGNGIATKTISITPALSSISGTATVCAGLTTTLSDSYTGGAWSSSNAAIAIISGTGVVTGISAGTTTITYAAAGTSVTTVVTVNALPAAITGTMAICASGGTTMLADGDGSGSWSSNNTAIATIDGSGNVTGIAAGNTSITYTANTGCIKTAMLTVNPLPSAITGATALCAGTTTTLNDLISGGTWSSGATAIATVGSATHIVTAVSSGTAIISYVLPTGCATSAAITVNALPSAITGSSTLCAGATTSLANASAGGTWSSSNTTIATIDASAGIVTGASAGTARITYSSGAGCITTTIVTVSALPASITGTASTCQGTTTTLADATTGGTWSSADITIATVGSTGIVTGVAAGTATVTYTSAAGCIVTKMVTINALPAAITGSNNLCIGTTTTLASSTSGGTWSSSAATVSVYAASGAVSGIAAGTASITYTLPGSCKTTSTITVNALPAVIAGTMTMCAGTTATLTDGTTGGTWSTGDATAAIGSASGIATGISAGTATVTYTTSAGCSRSATVTVNPLPSGITGSTALCIATTTTLADASTPGAGWTSSNTAIATIGASTGVLSGVAAGTATITYKLSTGCLTTTVITVNTVPPAISGTLKICAGAVSTLSDASSGGTWSSSNVGSVTASVIGASGIVTGLVAGQTYITYSLGVGCTRTATVTVNTSPAAITGTNTACIGTTTTLADGSAGGTWLSTNTGIATVNLSNGIVTGAAAGTTTISYTLSGCAATQIVSVIATPSISTGTTVLCVGSIGTLTNTAAGGTWSSQNYAIANVGSTTGMVTGVAAGTVSISYSFGGACKIGTVITVNAIPVVISGTATVCTGATTTLSDGTAGGTWTSAATAIATIGSSSRVVTGISAGTTTISYTLPTGCARTAVVTVNATPDAGTISGPSAIHISATPTIALTDVITGGIWSSSNTSVVTVDGSGNVTGVATGVATISYTVTNGSCTAAATQLISVSASRPAGNAVSSASDAVNIDLYPNPNKGTFTLKGILPGIADGQVAIEITDMLGQVVYTNNIAVQHETVNATIQINKTLASGIYLLNMHNDDVKATFHFVIEK